MRTWAKWVLALIIVALAAAIVLVYKGRGAAPEPVDEPVAAAPASRHEVIGRSVEGRMIEAVTFGSGSKRVVFVGDIHGGYEYNSADLANEIIGYLDDNSSEIPSGVSVTVIPTLNPDGLAAGIEPDTRFNARDVDLNRNFDCKWAPTSMWREQVVSAGTGPFSEPEAVALRDFTLKYMPSAFVFLHSMANAVYASECEDGILPETLDIMNAYADAAGYGKFDTFDAYAITGDAEGWLASIGIPAITVELSNHEDIEWEKNLAGMRALLDYYSGPSI